MATSIEPLSFETVSVRLGNRRARLKWWLLGWRQEMALKLAPWLRETVEAQATVEAEVSRRLIFGSPERIFGSPERSTGVKVKPWSD